MKINQRENLIFVPQTKLAKISTKRYHFDREDFFNILNLGNND